MPDLDIKSRSKNIFSTRGVKTGPGRGTILRYHKRGRLFAIGHIDIGGVVEQLAFEPELILKPGDRISFRRIKDASSPTGVKASRVKRL